MKRILGTPFGLALLGLLVLAGWAVWSAGVFDDAVARQVRSSSVYVAPNAGVDVDQTAAEHVIGNRRLVVVFLAPGADPGDECDAVQDATDDTIVVFLQPKDDEFDHYGCSSFPGGDDENFGKGFVAETNIASGADQFLRKPLDAVKVIAVNYDSLVKAGMIPDGSRTISPSLPRYLIAGAAVLAVLVGATALYFTGRRVARLAAGHRARLDAASDARGSVNVEAAVLAKQIIELDRRYSRATPDFRRKYRKLAGEYADLITDLTADTADTNLGERVSALTDRARSLATTGAGRKKYGRQSLRNR